MKEEEEEVERVSAKDITLKEFIEKYEKPGKVVIIKGKKKNIYIKNVKKKNNFFKKKIFVSDLMDDWPAMKNWTKEKLLENYGEKRFRTNQRYPRRRKYKMKLKDYFDYCENQKDDDPIYLFGKKKIIYLTFFDTFF